MYTAVVMITTVHAIMCADEFYDLPGRDEFSDLPG